MTGGSARQGAADGASAASESVARDQGVCRAGHSGAVAVASVMATAGMMNAVWHVRGHGEPEREWPRGRGRRAAGSGMGVHRSGHVPRGQSEELSGYPCNGHGGRRFSATAKYQTRANERGN